MMTIPLCYREEEQAVQGKQAMPAEIVERQENTVTIQVSIPLSRSMLDTEEAIQKALNQEIAQFKT